MKIRQRQCKICRTKYQPRSSFQKTCDNIKCAIAQTNLDKAKQRRKQDAISRSKLKPRSKWLKEVQQVFNRYIRERDKIQPCISCGRHHEGQYHAGHFYTTSARPDLRFNEDNCHKQCSACNTHLSGNIQNYRESLKRKLGLERLAKLEQVGRSSWDIEELKAIKKKYQALIKTLAK